MSMEVIEKAKQIEAKYFDKNFVGIEGNIIKIHFQDGTVKDKGVIGLQAVGILEFVRNIFIELDNYYPCTENAFTINTIQEAIHWQTKRTQDREKRGVEGYNKD